MKIMLRKNRQIFPAWCNARSRGPFKFVYCAQRGVDDALITLLHNIYSHLDNCKTYVRTLFIDFLSAFNTIRPQVLLHKLQHLNVNPHLALWINTFLAQWSQRVRVNGVSSDITYLSSGVPPGLCSITPFVLLIYKRLQHTKWLMCFD